MIGELDPFKGKEDERGGWGEIWKRKRGHKSFSIMIPPKWVQMICDVLIQRGGVEGGSSRGAQTHRGHSRRGRRSKRVGNEMIPFYWTAEATQGDEGDRVILEAIH